MSLAVFLAVGLLPPLTVAQTTVDTPTEPTSTADPATPSASPSTAAEECSWDGSVSEYLKCQKDSVSTTTLIAAGIGVTVGILLLVGLCVWLCHRQQSSRYPTQFTSAGAGSGEGAADKTATRRTYDSDNSDVEPQQPPVLDHKRKPRPPDVEALPLPIQGESSIKVGRDPRAARVNSASSSSDTDYLTPPPPHPAHMPKLALPSEILDSPIEHEQPRQLYPTNPSPAPRHLQTLAYAKRQSVSSTRTARVGETPVPPLPPAPARSTTAPLNIRKSAADPTYQSSRRPSGAIPSYYEATQGEAVSRPESRLAGPSLSMYGRSSSVPDILPPVPLANRPFMDARRPSAPAVHVHTQRKPSEGPRRGSAERGGMI